MRGEVECCSMGGDASLSADSSAFHSARPGSDLAVISIFCMGPRPKPFQSKIIR